MAEEIPIPATTFQIGISSPSRARRVAAKSKVKITVTPISVNFGAPRWFLLPRSYANHEVAFQTLSTFGGYGIRAILIEFRNQKQLKSPFADSEFQFKTVSEWFSPRSKECLREMNRLIFENQRVRWAFKRLATRWLGKRLRQANTEDLVTMEIPKNPVTIYDWPQRRKYIFEAKTLFRDLCEKLYFADQLFPVPMEPRNPFTNKPLSIGQMLHAHQATLKAGLTDWALASYAQLRFNMTEFRTQFYTPLKIHALDALFAAPTSADTVELLYDFIAAEYEYHELEFRNTNEWIWGLENDPKSTLIRTWSQFCYRYYRNLILSSPEDRVILEQKTHRESWALVRTPIASFMGQWYLSMQSPQVHGALP